MKLFFYWCGFIFLCTYGSAWSQTQQVSIMSYNIHHGKDADGQVTLDQMGDFIAGSGADIVGLQEVDSVCDRSHQVDQTKSLAQAAEMNHRFTRHFAFQGGAYGQGLLTKFPVLNLRNFRLPVFSQKKGTEVSVLLTDVHIDSETTLTIGVVHLDYRSSESRMKQAQFLIDSLSEIQNLVLVGDFNAYPDAPEMVRLREYFDVFPATLEAPTFPASNPDRRIDFVMVSKGSDFRIVDERVVDVPYSDHLPVITTLEY